MSLMKYKNLWNLNLASRNNILKINLSRRVKKVQENTLFEFNLNMSLKVIFFSYNLKLLSLPDISFINLYFLS